ncbi:hypothetical protein HDU96_001373 [Phlyctochytrium bullatum]|nr:hypothetical protein HDU96_001373 [Phlyctochytrium bullatum]
MVRSILLALVAAASFVSAQDTSIEPVGTEFSSTAAAPIGASASGSVASTGVPTAVAESGSVAPVATTAAAPPGGADPFVNVPDCVKSCVTRSVPVEELCTKFSMSGNNAASDPAFTAIATCVSTSCPPNVLSEVTSYLGALTTYCSLQPSLSLGETVVTGSRTSANGLATTVPRLATTTVRATTTTKAVSTTVIPTIRSTTAAPATTATGAAAAVRGSAVGVMVAAAAVVAML